MKVCLLFLIFYAMYIEAAIYRLNESEYKRMPPIVTLDPYWECLQRGGWYCSGYVVFVADEPSPLLDLIQEYSTYTATHFNHSKAFYGTCITEKCKDFYDDEDGTTRDMERVLEACLNHSVSEQYNLKVKLEADLICNKQDAHFKVDLAEIVVAGIVLMLVTLNIIGSFVDIYCAKQHRWTGATFLMCFSIPRNWNKLIAPPSADPRLETFKGIYAAKFILMSLVVVGHAIIPVVTVCANPKFVEDAYDITMMQILLNGPFLMQCFLFLSAMLQTYHLLIHAETHTINWKIVPIGIILRWFRLTPSFALVFAITATWLPRIGMGPVWHEIVTVESIDCKRDWWLPLLYIHNYVDYSKCMPHAWFLAADSQLFILGLIVFVLCQKTKYRNVILSLLLVIGMIIPTLHTYFQDLDGVLIASPILMMELFIKDKTFNSTYKRGHTNLPSYIMGMAGGYLLYYLLKNNFNDREYKKYRYLQWCSLSALVFMPTICKVLYAEGPRTRLLYRVLLAAFMNPVYGLLTALCIIGLILKIDGLWVRISEWRVFVAPGRMSFSAYLMHAPLVRIIGGLLTEPLEVSYLLMVKISVGLVVLTYLIASVFFVTVEAPLGQMFKHYVLHFSGLKNKPGYAKQITEKTHNQIEDNKTK